MMAKTSETCLQRSTDLPMNSPDTVAIFLPLGLFAVMFAVGMSLSVKDFRVLLSRPGVLVLGALLQLVLLPLLGLAVVTLFALPAVLAAGLMIVTFAPGGATSNLMCLLCRADTALSVSLTVISGLIIPFTLPVLSVFTLQQLQPGGAAIDLPVGPTIAKLLAIGVLPVILGMLLRHWQTEFCIRSRRWIKAAAALIMLLVVTALTVAQMQGLMQLLPVLAPAVLTLATGAMLLAFMAGRWSGVGTPRALTLAIETGIQNAGTGLVITAVILQNPDMSAAVLLYGILMQVPALGLIIWRNLPGHSGHRSPVLR
ncbi:bile acid:sodium symporter family protein [Aliamphritea hakodatensis]|uniref:bile acid:sodium symporter family protein n=1 Tax=Aliamphritea hakodatensis TaxID=2895352 RepID=UPI0022FD829C|nr:bile acid:sodium symporter [Aliamphritea hakodatensis]